MSSLLFYYKNYDLDVSVGSKQPTSPQDSEQLKSEGFQRLVVLPSES